MRCESPQLISEGEESRTERGPQIVQPSQNSLSILGTPASIPGPEGEEMSHASLIKWLRKKKKMLVLEEENESRRPGKRGLSPPHYARSGA